MRKIRRMKQMVTYLLAFCMLVSGFLIPDYNTVYAAESTTVYFLNDQDWSDVCAYAYYQSNPNEKPLGEYEATKTSDAVKDALEIGSKWKKVTVTGSRPFSIKFYNKANDTECSELIIENNLYVFNNAAYATSREAETAAGITTVYFLNDSDWAKVGAYAYDKQDGDKKPLGEFEDTKTSDAVKDAPEIGSKWKKVTVPCSMPFSLKIYNKDKDTECSELIIENNLYVFKNAAYATSREAETAAGITTVYFLNDSDWAKVGAYAYYTDGERKEPLGTFEQTKDSDAVIDASELGGKWKKVTVPRKAGFSIVFYNKEKTDERSELIINENLYVYNNQAYGTTQEAETAAYSTTVYFLNHSDWNTVGAYAYYKDKEGKPLGDFAADTNFSAVSNASELGGKWKKVTVPSKMSFSIIFYNKDNTEERSELIIDGNLYVHNGVAYETKDAAEAAAGESITLYFFNTKGWTNIGAYIWGAGKNRNEEPLGGWKAAMAKNIVKDASAELGQNWYKLDVPTYPPFNLILVNKDNDVETERVTPKILDKAQVYLTANNESFASKLEAEYSMGMADEKDMTVAYFYNDRDWEFVSAFTSTKDGKTIGKSWPGSDAQRDTSLGGKWYKIVIPKVATAGDPVYATIHDGGNRINNIEITSQTGSYIIPNGAVYKSKDEAEAALKNIVYDDYGCEEGPNKDLTAINYENEAGANLPYVTYEAEAASTNAEVLAKDATYILSMQSEASGRSAVKLAKENDYVEFTLTEPSNTMVLRYAIPDSEDGTGIDATLNMSINGTSYTDLELTSKYAWLYGAFNEGAFEAVPSEAKDTNGDGVIETGPHRFYDEMRLMLDKEYPAGTKIRLEKKANNTAAYYIIDFMEGELVGKPIAQPAGSISVVEYGATANDGTDDYQAFVNCIKAAKAAGKEVWIPEGTFNLTEKKELVTESVNVRGAGMWYTNLVGAGVSFRFNGTCKFSDFSMTGVSTVRDNANDLAGFEPSVRSTNTTIENIWMEHIKVGVWSANTENLLIQGCRIRNTWADGINLCTLTTNATVRNNNLRYTGDDCIAIWPWLNDCKGNTIEHNTVQLPSLANGVALYGGGNNKVLNNHALDIIGNGAGICVGTEFDIKKPYHDTVLVENNVLDRCGSMQFNENYPIGALWIWAAEKNPLDGAEILVKNNKINDSVHSGICVEVGNKLVGVRFEDNKITGGTDGIHVLGAAAGQAVFKDIEVIGQAGQLIRNEAANFTYTTEGKGIYAGSSAGGNEGGSSTGGNEGGSSAGGNEGGSSAGGNEGGSSADELQNTKVKTIQIVGISNNIAYNKKIKLKAIVTPTGAENKSVKWSVSNKKYASVSKNGVVTFTKAARGKKVTIIATAADGSGVKAAYKIKVMKKSITKIKLKASKTIVKAGSKVKIKAVVSPSKNVYKKLEWKSSNTKYATVDKNGVVKTKKQGKGKVVKITAKALDGSGKKAVIKIKIK